MRNQFFPGIYMFRNHVKNPTSTGRNRKIIAAPIITKLLTSKKIKGKTASAEISMAY
jgi:hypothetical protein